MNNTQNKPIPIIIRGFKFYDRVLYYKMNIIDSHFHNIYRNYQRYIEIRKNDISYRNAIEKNSKRDRQKIKLLKRIRNEIKYMEKYLMKRKYKNKVLFTIIDENISSYNNIHYDGQYEVCYGINGEIVMIFRNYQKLRNYILFNFMKFKEILKYAENITKYPLSETTIYKKFYLNGLEQEEIENKIRDLIKKFEGYFKEKMEFILKI